MLDTLALASIGLTFFVITASPGPATLGNAAVAMSHGGRAGLKYAMGLTLGLMFWGLLAVSGTGILLQQSVYVLTGLKVLGGFYLLWLAFGSARSALKPASLTAEVLTQERGWIWCGILLNLSNPQAVFAWMAVLSVGMPAESNICVLVVGFVLCVVVAFVVYLVYALLFSRNGIMNGYRRFRRWIDGTVAGLFTLAAIVLIRSVFAH